MENVKELTYEQAYEKLEEIVEKMGSASVPLGDMMTLYEDGMELAEHCEKLLNSYDARLEKVAKRALLRELESEEAGQAEADDEEEAPF